ncbi:sigma-70 family RNA polymerase sigma factor [Paludisphaera sp.]|uniref:sigma-70 family RNA polymerase sigma factor n=1 Tax=Paludisphaera sp. TaxID=2017432 RepID=UPI00301B732E
MGERDRGAIVQGLGRLLSRGVDPSGDGDLLERFRARRDEDAFEALVRRHGPMVRGVCRRILRDPADVDDAFQATFLVLARKGPGLRDPDRLGPWLHGVASRVAAKSRSRSARSRTGSLADDIPARDDGRAEWSDVMPILDAELARLPSAQRDVLVACLLNGSTEQEAAITFACPVGTIKSRLSRAREALRSRLVRRGIAPATATLAAASSPGSFASPVSAPLLRATLAMVAAPAAVPAAVAALTSGVAPMMLSRILLSGAAIAGGLALVGLSATAWTADPPPAQEATRPASIAKAVPGDRAQLDRNLKTLLLALHNHHAAEGSFPPPAIRSVDGRPLLSWRVAILPLLDQQELYNEFRLHEPWDSTHNRQLIARMPAVFETPGHPAPPGKTRIRGIDAPGAMFGPPDEGGPADAGMMGMGAMMGTGPADTGMMGMGAMMGGGAPPADATVAVEKPTGGGKAEPQAARGMEIRDVLDGTSNTAFLVVAEDAVEWTRPGELNVPGGITPGGDMPALVEDADGYILGMVDGAVRRLPRQPNRRELLLPALLTRAGGEVLSSEIFGPPLPAPRPEPKAGPEPTAPASFDRRLRRVEEKLDDILDRLDALAPPRP